MNNDFDIKVIFRNEFLLVLQYEIVRYSYLQVSGVKVFIKYIKSCIMNERECLHLNMSLDSKYGSFLLFVILTKFVSFL